MPLDGRPALVCVDDATRQAAVTSALNELGYASDVPSSADNALDRMRKTAYEVVVVDETFEGATPLDNSILKGLAVMNMTVRRYMFVALIGRNVPTLDNATAFARSVNAVFSYGDLDQVGPMLQRAIAEHDAFSSLTGGRQRAGNYRLAYEAGRRTLRARRIMDALVAEHPQYTRGLRASSFMLDARQTREFERAMAELQQGLWIVKTEERYEPTFSYRWDLLEAWLPEPVAAGRRLSRERALEHLIGRHVGGAVFTRERALGRLLGVPGTEIARAVRALVARGALSEMEIAGWPGRWLIAPAAARGPGD